MNRNTVRWIIAVLLLAALALGLSSPSVAEEAKKLPLDYTEGGYPARPGGWTHAEDGTPLEYDDSTIHVSVTKGEVVFPVKGKNVKHETFVIRIKIQDVSQLRTAASNDKYKGGGAAEAEDMARDKKAIIAMNGDYFKGGNRDAMYLVRQGELIRDYTHNKRNWIFDMLVIDSEGDFHVVPSAVTENIEAFVAETLTPQGRTILDTFNLGPVLVVDGQAQDISNSEAVKRGEYQWKYPQQRIALVQTGHLEYAIVEVYGRTDSSAGMDLNQFAEFIVEQCPDAMIAYNLDGGGSTNLVVTEYNESYVEGSKKKGEREILKSKRICVTPGHREIHDIIYFASADDSPVE